jgi:hypothetical protein
MIKGKQNLFILSYTSLGSKTNTQPNQTLKNALRVCGYSPAYLLEKAELERAGRQ